MNVAEPEPRYFEGRGSLPPSSHNADVWRIFGLDGQPAISRSLYGWEPEERRDASVELRAAEVAKKDTTAFQYGRPRERIEILAANEVRQMRRCNTSSSPCLKLKHLYLK